MDDLISRQAALDALRGLYINNPKINNDYAYDTALDIAHDVIKALPSAQQEIVHCKDCKHVGTDATCCLVCNREGMGLRPYHVYHDDYCSYGKRRTDETD